MCDAAGLPRKQKPNGEWVRLCTPHGLRKRCCADMADRECTAHEIIEIVKPRNRGKSWHSCGGAAVRDELWQVWDIGVVWHSEA